MSKPEPQAWAPAFTIEQGDHDIAARLNDLAIYAKMVTGFRITGVRVRLQIERDGPPMPQRMKKLLKFAKRKLGLKCIDFGVPGESTTPARQPTPAKHVA